MIFSVTLTFRGPFQRKVFKWKKYGGAGLISEKAEFFYAELNERAEAATGSYSVTGDFLQYIYSVAKKMGVVFLRTGSYPNAHSVLEISKC